MDMLRKFVTTSTLASLILASSLEVYAVNRIAIKALASEDYLTDRAAPDGSMKMQTYQFMRGNYHPGSTADEEMVEITFEDIVYDMAEHLAKQNFYPEPELGKSDLLIVVHWGRTIYDQDEEQLLGYTGAEDLGYTDTVATADADGVIDSDEMVEIVDLGFQMAAFRRDEFGFQMETAANSSDGTDRSVYYKAQLLGMEDAFHRDTTVRDEILLKTLLQQERYFVALMAYDFQLLQEGEIDLLWTTRYSIRATGQSYRKAIREMNFVAGDFFGKNLKGLTQRRLDDKSRVEIGEIEVIGDRSSNNRSN